MATTNGMFSSGVLNVADAGARRARCTRGACAPRTCALYALEMLVVITIIGLLSTLDWWRQGDDQVNHDGRNRSCWTTFLTPASAHFRPHHRLCVLFRPTSSTNHYPLTGNTAIDNAITNLYTAQCTTYACFRCARSAINRHHSPHYLTAWRTLPNGVYIATNKFSMVAITRRCSRTTSRSFSLRHEQRRLLFALSVLQLLGQLVDSSGNLLNSSQHEFIQLVRGGVYYSAGNRRRRIPGNAQGQRYYAGYNTTPALNNQVLPVPRPMTKSALTADREGRVLHQDVQ